MGHDNDDEFIDTGVEILRTQVIAFTSYLIIFCSV